MQKKILYNMYSNTDTASVPVNQTKDVLGTKSKINIRSKVYSLSQICRSEFK